MSQHPNASPSPLAGEIAAVIGEFVTAQANAMHAVARLAMLTRDLVEGTALQTSAPEIRQEIADLAERLPPVVAAEPRTNRAERREMILDLYATTDLTGHAIARRAGVVLDTPRKIIRKAREAGDRRAAQGDLRRQSAADQAAPLQTFPSTPHDGLPENGGNASSARPEETGASGISPAQGEEVVPTSRAGEAVAAADDPAPAPELRKQTVMEALAERSGGVLRALTEAERLSLAQARADAQARATVGLSKRSAIDALRSANERILRPAAEMELADELEDEPAPRRAVPQEPVTKRGPAGLAQRAAKKVEKREEPAAPVIKVEVLTEEQVGLPILHVDKKAKTITGPLGAIKDCTVIMMAVADRLADGRLYGHEKIQQIAGVARKDTFDRMLDRWKAELRGIGVEVWDRAGYGLRLQRREVA